MVVQVSQSLYKDIEVGQDFAYMQLYVKIHVMLLIAIQRIHTESPIRSAESTEVDVSKKGVTFFAQQARERRTASKWALQWRSIILSSLGKTAYPYCLYIRSLQLSNLSELFEDPPFASVYDDFFAGDMAIFFKTRDPQMAPKRSKRRYAPRLAITTILDMVGESISKYAAESAQTFGGTAVLEELSGHIERAALPRWVARLPRLKSLTLWDGAVLNKETADAIKPNCNDFESLDLMLCKGDQADTDLADFFFGLNANSMRLLQMISSNDLGGQTFLALSSHGESLKDLSLGSLHTSALRVLSLLKGCKALQTLTLESSDPNLDLEATENDTYLEIIAWLTSCKHLKSVRLQNFLNGPAILTSVCLEEQIKLEKLELLGYNVVGNRDFHLSLSQQTSLESLYLRGDATGAFRDDNDILVSSICKLTNLTYLNIIDTSDFFENAEIKLMATHLPKVSELCS